MKVLLRHFTAESLFPKSRVKIRSFAYAKEKGNFGISKTQPSSLMLKENSGYQEYGILSQIEYATYYNDQHNTYEFKKHYKVVLHS